MPDTEPDNAMMTKQSARALAFRRMLSDKPDFYELVTNYCLLGADDHELARFFHVDRDTWLVWVKHSEDLRDAIDEGFTKADARVAKAMLKRATGYSYDRQRLVIKKDGSSQIIDLVEHVPPDTAAGKFWLTNRQPRHWADRQDHTLTGRDGGAIDGEMTIKFVSSSPLLNITPPPANEDGT